MRGVVAVDHGMVMTNPRVNSAPSFCWCVSHTQRGVAPRVGFKRIIFDGFGSSFGACLSLPSNA